MQREVPPGRLGRVFGHDHHLLSEAIDPLGLLLVPVLVPPAGDDQASSGSRA